MHVHVDNVDVPAASRFDNFDMTSKLTSIIPIFTVDNWHQLTPSRFFTSRSSLAHDDARTGQAHGDVTVRNLGARQWKELLACELDGFKVKKTSGYD